MPNYAINLSLTGDLQKSLISLNRLSKELAVSLKKVSAELRNISQSRGLSSVQTQLSRTSQSASNTASAFGRTNTSMSSLSGIARSLGPSLSAGSAAFSALSTTAGLAGVALYAFGAAAVAATSQYAKFEHTLTRTGAIFQTSEAGYAKIEAAARDMGATTQYTATQAAEALMKLAQAGLSATESVEVLPTVLNLAAAGALDLASAADIVTNVMSTFSKSTSEMAEVADVLTQASISANTTVKDLGGAMKYIGPIAVQAGVSLEQTTAVMSLLANSGLNGTKMATSFRLALSRMLNPTKKAQATLQKLNQQLISIGEAPIEFTNSKGELNDLSDIVDKLGKSGATAGDLITLFAKEGATAMGILKTNGGAALDAFTASLKLSGGVAERLATEQMDTLIGSFKKLSSASQELLLTIGKPIADAFKGIVDVTTDFVGVISKVIKHIFSAHSNFVVLGVAVKGIEIAFRALVTGLKVVLVIMKKVTDFFGGNTKLNALADSIIGSTDSIIERQQELDDKLDDMLSSDKKRANEHTQAASKRVKSIEAEIASYKDLEKAIRAKAEAENISTYDATEEILTLEQKLGLIQRTGREIDSLYQLQKARGEAESALYTANIQNFEAILASAKEQSVSIRQLTKDYETLKSAAHKSSEDQMTDKELEALKRTKEAAADLESTYTKLVTSMKQRKAAAGELFTSADAEILRQQVMQANDLTDAMVRQDPAIRSVVTGLQKLVSKEKLAAEAATEYAAKLREAGASNKATKESADKIRASITKFNSQLKIAADAALPRMKDALKKVESALDASKTKLQGYDNALGHLNTTFSKLSSTAATITGSLEDIKVDSLASRVEAGNLSTQRAFRELENIYKTSTAARAAILQQDNAAQVNAATQSITNKTELNAKLVALAAELNSQLAELSRTQAESKLQDYESIIAGEEENSRTAQANIKKLQQEVLQTSEASLQATQASQQKIKATEQSINEERSLALAGIKNQETAFNKLTAEIKKTENQVASLAAVIDTMGSTDDLAVTAKFTELNTQLSSTASLAYLQSLNDIGKIDGSNLESVQTAIEGLGESFEKLGNETLAEALTTGAESAIALIVKDVESTALKADIQPKNDVGDLTAKQVESRKYHATILAEIQTRSSGGVIQGYNTGGAVFKRLAGHLPGFGGGDKIPALLEAGEFIIRKGAVRQLGLSALQFLNQFGQLPKFQVGGPVSKPSSSAMAPMNGSAPNYGTLNFSLNGNSVGSLTADGADIQALLYQLNRARRTSA